MIATGRFWKDCAAGVFVGGARVQAAGPAQGSTSLFGPLSVPVLR
ncbi:MAG: hypothetical protein QF819_07405 [Gemmatimonadota bacterium]|jgi:hypothetical protein|nr:hypothetical protein [Gemmatimonadota bacterium]MDP6529793.1 hypothetical protein [Gemmatimonadota bacterium]MDP6802985.1 hypothetical protein [Gemmatimonadota bacterium]MDP7032611.1 hypothetical protein [Gemmatimonadota bacterium]